MIWTVIVLFLLIGLMGLATDIGYYLLVAHQLQNAADAASLAGAALVRNDAAGARQAAQDVGMANEAAGELVALFLNVENAAEGDIVIGRYDSTARLFTPTLTGANSVKVVARRTSEAHGKVDLFFGPLFGVSSANISREAIAAIGGSTGAGLITLHETDRRTFRLSGTVMLDVTDVTVPGGAGGAIQVNSNNPEALKFDGTSGTLVASEINVFADEANIPPPEVFEGDVNPSRPRIPDPLAGMVPPPPGANHGTFKVTGGTHTISPGYYPGGISMTGGNVTLESGIYTVAGEGLDVTGGNLIGQGVMFYVLDGKKSNVNLTGNGNVDITPLPLDEGPYGGIAIWQSAENDNEATIRGTDQFQGIDGTLYFPKAHVDIVGTSDSFGIAQLICDTVGISGTGNLTIHYDGRFKAPGTSVYLVE